MRGPQVIERKFGRSKISALRVKNSVLFCGFLAATIALLCLIVPASGIAHSGGLDKNGCHNNNTKHVFECHSGLLKGQTFKSKAEALKALEKKKKEAGTPSKKSVATAPNAQTSAMKSQPPQQIPVNRK
jgi:hypothetical protein